MADKKLLLNVQHKLLKGSIRDAFKLKHPPISGILKKGGGSRQPLDPDFLHANLYLYFRGGGGIQKLEFQIVF
jgi:hypothetical protein